MSEIPAVYRLSFVVPKSVIPTPFLIPIFSHIFTLFDDLGLPASKLIFMTKSGCRHSRFLFIRAVIAPPWHSDQKNVSLPLQWSSWDPLLRLQMTSFDPLLLHV